MKLVYKIGANIFFLLHILVGLIILFGWLFPQLKVFYLIILILWPVSWIMLGYCPLTKLEFLLRKKYRKSVNTNAEFIQYNMYRFFHIHIPRKKVFVGGLIFFLISAVLNVV